MNKQECAIWVTTYALTDGILYFPKAEIDCQMAVVGRHDSQSRYFFGEGKNWHRTEQAAIQRAESMRVKKVASLKKTLMALQKMRFKTAE